MQTLAFEIQNGIIREILDISDVSVLGEIQNYLRKKQKEKYKLNTFQINQLEKSEKEAQEGLLIHNEQVFNEIDQWLNQK